MEGGYHAWLHSLRSDWIWTPSKMRCQIGLEDDKSILKKGQKSLDYVSSFSFKKCSEVQTQWQRKK